MRGLEWANTLATAADTHGRGIVLFLALGSIMAVLIIGLLLQAGVNKWTR